MIKVKILKHENDNSKVYSGLTGYVSEVGDMFVNLDNKSINFIKKINKETGHQWTYTPYIPLRYIYYLKSAYCLENNGFDLE